MVTARPLRVGFLAYGLDRPPSGVTRVAWELGEALRARQDCEMVFLTPYRRGPFGGPAGHAALLPGCSRLPVLMALGGPLIALAARRWRLDVVHDPTGVSPFTLGRWSGRFRRVVTLHDAIAFHHANGYPLLNNLLHRWYAPSNLANVDHVITVSAHAATDLVAALPLTRERLSVVPNGVHPRFHPVAADVARAVARRYGLEGRYVLNVGAQQARKNLGRLLVAFAQVRQAHPDCRLAIVGQAMFHQPALRTQAARLGLDGAVRLLGFVPDEDLAALYSGASLLAHPSLYEGFGLPVLEAMACGTPVMASNRSALPEVAQGAALLVNPLDVGTLAGAICRVLAEPALARDLSQRGLARAAAFTWERAAEQTVAVYRRTLGMAAARPHPSPTETLTSASRRGDRPYAGAPTWR